MRLYRGEDGGWRGGFSIASRERCAECDYRPLWGGWCLTYSPHHRARLWFCEEFKPGEWEVALWKFRALLSTNAAEDRYEEAHAIRAGADAVAVMQKQMGQAGEETAGA